MNQERSDFKSTPMYDDFLEMREDLINRFIELYDTTGSTMHSGAATREELEKVLHKFEIENQERIIHSRNTAEERKRRKIESIIEAEGTMFDRVNVDYKDRDSVIDHELAVQYADLLARKGDADSKFNHHTSADLLNRKTRLIVQQGGNLSQASMPVIAEASGCRDLWKLRAINIIKQSFILA